MSTQRRIGVNQSTASQLTPKYFYKYHHAGFECCHLGYAPPCVNRHQPVSDAQAVRPDKVVVELCKSRAPMMWAPERTSGDGQGQNGGDNSTNLAALGGENLFSAVQRTVELGGVPALGMRLLLGGLSRGLEKAVGQRSGQEFKEAWLGAQSLGVEVVLGETLVQRLS